MPLAPGTRLSQYEILSPLGAGSMGEVYRARDTRLDRDVAIKVLPELVSTAPERLQRFEVEAKAAAALNHPNILAVYQMGTYAGVPYLVSELLEGKTLAETVRRGPLPLRKAIDYGVQIAHGLAAAHEKGIIHRDLKPDNLFVTKEGRVKILDFGLAKVAPPNDAAANAAPTLTCPASPWEPWATCRPSRCADSTTDHRTDIFAFGAILYEMVMGKRTFERKTSADTMSAILNEEPVPISESRAGNAGGPAASGAALPGKECGATVSVGLRSGVCPGSAVGFGIGGAVRRPCDPERRKRQRGQDANETAPSFPHGARSRGVGVCCGCDGARLFLDAARTLPTVSNYMQLTHDGQPKSLIGTDGSRLYLGLGAGSSESFARHGVAEMSICGRRAQKNLDHAFSGHGSRGFVAGWIGTSRGRWAAARLRAGRSGVCPFLEVLRADSETPREKPPPGLLIGKMLAYSDLSDLFVAKADGTDFHKLLTVKGDIKNVTWSPDDSHVQFDTTESAGTTGQQLLWEVAVDGYGFASLARRLHTIRQTNVAASGPPTGSISSSNRTVRSGLFREKAAGFTQNQSPSR